VSDHITYLGNPVPHEAKTQEGQIVGTTPLDVGPTITAIHWQPDVIAALKAHRAEIEVALEDRAALLELLLTTPRRNEWQEALYHIITVLRAHGSGFSFVAGHDRELEAILGAVYDAEVAPKGTAAALQLAAEADPEQWQEQIDKLHGPVALKTTAGVDLMHNASFGTSAQPAAANYVALTANNEAPSSASTSLAGEITTAEGGLIRKQVTYAHTTGASTSTLTGTFTANSHDALPVTVNKIGVLNKATSGGTLAIETKITAATFNLEGDALTLTDTFTIS